jgi:hypothetical protein
VSRYAQELALRKQLLVVQSALHRARLRSQVAALGTRAGVIMAAARALYSAIRLLTR